MYTPLPNPEEPFFQVCNSLEEAIHWAVWLEFIHRNQAHRFGVVDGPESYSAVNQAMADELEVSFFQDLEEDIEHVSYPQLKAVAKAQEPAPFWEALLGSFSTLDSAVLRFVLEHKVPLEKLIRLELAHRGVDKQGDWCGFDRAERIWLCHA